MPRVVLSGLVDESAGWLVWLGVWSIEGGQHPEPCGRPWLQFSMGGVS